jgi:hypothetical protein
MKILQCFKYILYSTPSLLRRGKPTNANQKDYDFAIDAFLALGED